jgi:hypothetical protein
MLTPALSRARRRRPPAGFVKPYLNGFDLRGARLAKRKRMCPDRVLRLILDHRHGAAARALGRPVKWCDERADSFLLDQQGRGTVVDAELALDQAGNFLCGLARDPLPDGRATCQRHGSEVATPMPPSGVRTLRAGVNPCRDQLAEGRLIPGRWLAACTRLPAPPDQ